MNQLMTTREVAEYLRIKERKVYDLVRDNRIPCTRVTGKWLFPKHLIDHWLATGTEIPDRGGAALSTPAVCAGSHDPLLEWSLRESGCELAMMPGGSLDGLDRLAKGEAMVAGMHVYEPGTDSYNQATVAAACKGLGVVLIEWAWRRQGLVLAPGNPLGIGGVKDLALRQARVIARQPEAGAQILFEHLLAEAGLAMAELEVLAHPAMSETDLGLSVLEGKADAGLAVASVAHQYRLDFIELHQERYDLAVRRRDYFEAPVQALLAFVATDGFKDRAAEMPGYDVSGLGRVAYNAP
ncbi:MAG: helix-turn-helix transcriptional regulator [Proteobacteria bacterium]|nr:helix-turn-helix transcriptional regulator [Pseudomonadota bacterium]